jgi:hypothetical protein
MEDRRWKQLPYTTYLLRRWKQKKEGDDILDKIKRRGTQEGQLGHSRGRRCYILSCIFFASIFLLPSFY